MTGQRRVIALMPAYNPDPQDLELSIRSLQAQTVPIDICLVDDGSRTRLDAMLPPAEGLHILRMEPNVGITRALMAGVDHALANGYDFICRLDAGDIAYPERVERQLTHMDAHPAVDILGSYSRVLDKAGTVLHHYGTAGGTEGVRNFLWYNSAFKHSTFFMRSASLRREGNYDPDFPLAQDYELLMRMARRGQVDCLPDVLIDYVDDPTGLSASKRARQLRMRRKALLKHAAPAVPGWYLGLARILVTIITPYGWAKSISNRMWRAKARRAGM